MTFWGGFETNKTPKIFYKLNENKHNEIFIFIVSNTMCVSLEIYSLS